MAFVSLVRNLKIIHNLFSVIIYNSPSVNPNDSSSTVLSNQPTENYFRDHYHNSSVIISARSLDLMYLHSLTMTQSRVSPSFFFNMLSLFLPKALSILPIHMAWPFPTYLSIVISCCYLITKLCLTPCDPMDWTVVHQTPLSMGFLRQKYWSGLSFSSPGPLPEPESK